jgi:hypothetical protein
MAVKSLAVHRLRSSPSPPSPALGKEYDLLHEYGVPRLCGLIELPTLAE